MKNDNRPATYTRPQVEALLRKWMKKAALETLEIHGPVNWEGRAGQTIQDVMKEVAASIVAGMKVDL
jgi:hypothetical protein